MLIGSAMVMGARFVLVLLSCIGWGQPRLINGVSCWSHIVPILREAADTVSAKVHQRLQDGIAVRRLPLNGGGFDPSHLFATRSILGECPRYLRAKHHESTYYLYVSQTPDGFYVSQWLFLASGTLLANLILKFLRLFHISQETLFQFDSTVMLRILELKQREICATLEVRSRRCDHNSGAAEHQERACWACIVPVRTAHSHFLRSNSLKLMPMRPISTVSLPL
jgi:hypothetical protein